MAKVLFFPPPTAFYFKVKIGNVYFSFKEVSGLNTELEVEILNEGGSTVPITLPKGRKNQNLVLKRALNPVSGEDLNWFLDIFGEGGGVQKIKTHDILIELLNPKEEPVYTWHCKRAYPIKWEMDGLDAEKNSVLIESIEFAYADIIRIPNAIIAE